MKSVSRLVWQLVLMISVIGGTLMDETITRSAGARHGQEMSPQQMEAILAEVGRPARQRTTLYKDVSEERRVASYSTMADAASCVMPLVAQSAATNGGVGIDGHESNQALSRRYLNDEGDDYAQAIRESRRSGFCGE